ncbi:glycosyltransferase family 2 protein [Pseudaestuariivita rosea]|uniref:glycosyltransferase family 2 protein n=1 Tax=Pseudaestuariivita rosea TaxID=2763263 RepID=UPI001ABB506C
MDLAHPFSPARAKMSIHVPIIISVMKNELSILPDFLRHHRELGAERFIIIDNGSTDGSIPYCAAQADIELHVLRRPFVWPRKQGWISRIIAQTGYDRWYIYLDADEQIVFDGAPERSLGDLAAWADQQGLRRVRGMLLDMYAAGPVLKFSWDGKSPLASAFQFFDSDSYVEDHYQMLISRKGGPRPRKLSASNPKFRPEMTKYPLFKPRQGDIMDNPHYISPPKENFLSGCMIALQHYKFLPGFVAKAEAAIKNKTYFSGSAEYQTYLAALAPEPELTLQYDGTTRYNGPNNLIEAGLIDPIDWSNVRQRPLCMPRRKARLRLIEKDVNRVA